MIPISLYVSIEIVKVCQVYFIHQDVELHDAETGSQLQCRALNITEDLGQIQYIFSDKTGTLTENRMVFRRCVVSGVEYSHDANGESARGRPGSALRPGRAAPPPTAASEADRRRTAQGVRVEPILRGLGRKGRRMYPFCEIYKTENQDYSLRTQQKAQGRPPRCTPRVPSKRACSDGVPSRPRRLLL